MCVTLECDSIGGKPPRYSCWGLSGIGAVPSRYSRSRSHWADIQSCLGGDWAGGPEDEGRCTRGHQSGESRALRFRKSADLLVTVEKRGSIYRVPRLAPRPCQHHRQVEGVVPETAVVKVNEGRPVAVVQDVAEARIAVNEAVCCGISANCILRLPQFLLGSRQITPQLGIELLTIPGEDTVGVTAWSRESDRRLPPLGEEVELCKHRSDKPEVFRCPLGIGDQAAFNPGGHGQEAYAGSFPNVVTIRQTQWPGAWDHAVRGNRCQPTHFRLHFRELTAIRCVDAQGVSLVTNRDAEGRIDEVLQQLD